MDQAPRAEEALMLDRLVSGDRPSIVLAGMITAHSLQKHSMAIFMVNALGQVVVMPPEAVEVKRRPLIMDEDLNKLSEEQAILLMDGEGRSEEEIISYLQRRES